MCLHELAGERQAKAERPFAVTGAAHRAVEAVEHPRLLAERDAAAVVRDDDPGPSLVAAALHLHQLYAAVAADNSASLRLFRGGGFETIGTRPRWLLGLGGRWIDVVELQRLL